MDKIEEVVQQVEKMLADGPKRVRAKKAAELLGVACSTLARWRTEGSGPVFIKFGHAVRYDVSDLNRWLDENKRRSTSDLGDCRTR